MPSLKSMTKAQLSGRIAQLDEQLSAQQRDLEQLRRQLAAARAVRPRSIAEINLLALEAARFDRRARWARH